MVKLFSKKLYPRISLIIFLFLTLVILLILGAFSFFGNFEKLESVNYEAILTNDDALVKFLKKNGPKETILTIANLAPKLGIDCHQRAHHAGRIAAKVLNVEKAFREGSGECHSGYYHGTTEGYFAKFGTKNLSENLSKLCTADLNSFFRHQCFHGVGHGLMAWTNYEIFEALKSCDQLSDGQASCATGVFMENFIGAFGEGTSNGDGHSSKYLSDDPHYPCNIVADNYKSNCYFLQTSRMLQIFAGDFEKVVKACLEAPINYQSSCFQSMGRDVGGLTRGNPQASVEKCNLVPFGNLRTDCLTGAVQDYFWDPDGANLVISFCRKLTDSEEKRACYNRIIARAGDILVNRVDLEKFCQKLETDFQTLCQLTIS